MAGRSKNSASNVYTAKHAFACEIDGAPVFVQVGERVRGGSELVERYSEYFEFVGVDDPKVEQATAGPGERRTQR